MNLDETRQRRAREKRARRELRGHGDYVLRLGDACPACGYGIVIEGPVTDVGPIDVCLGCSAMWERETRAHPTLERCSECAFSPGSPEQRDPEEWGRIVEQTVRRDGRFLCHKRVPFALKPDGTYEYRHRDGEGKVVHGTLCHGWVKARCAALVRECEVKEPATT